MKLNIGSLDKILRIIGGLIIIIIGFVFNSWWGLIGIIPLVTGIIGWCPLYSLFGTSTHKMETEKE